MIPDPALDLESIAQMGLNLNLLVGGHWKPPPQSIGVCWSAFRTRRHFGTKVAGPLDVVKSHRPGQHPFVRVSPPKRNPHSVSAGPPVVGFPPLTDSAVEKAYTRGHTARLPRVRQVFLPPCNSKELQWVAERHRPAPEFPTR